MRPWTRTLLFCALPALVFGTPALVLWLGGEFASPVKVLARQLGTKALVIHGPAFTNPVIYMKTRAVAQTHPEILALGTSRVLQFRDNFFLPGVNFYNCGSCIQRVQHLRQLVSAIPKETQPKLLIVGIEQAWFNARSGYAEQRLQGPAWFDAQCRTLSEPFSIYRTNCWTVYQQLWIGKLNAAPLLSFRGLNDRVGFSAVMIGRGTRNDGSYAYPEYHHDTTDARHTDRYFKNHGFDRIRNHVIPFEWADQLHEVTVRELESFLELCKDRGIQVVGFLPPYPHVIWQTMQEAGAKYAYQPLVPLAVRPMLESRGFEFYDFSDMGSLDAPDSEAIDSFHGSEKVYVRLLIRMLEQGSRLNGYVSLPMLQEALNTAKLHHDIVAE